MSLTIKNVLIKILLPVYLLVQRVWSVRFNPTYDQLVLTGSSDSQVFLCRVASVASEPMRDLDDDSSRK